MNFAKKDQCQPSPFAESVEKKRVKYEAAKLEYNRVKDAAFEKAARTMKETGLSYRPGQIAEMCGLSLATTVMYLNKNDHCIRRDYVPRHFQLVELDENGEPTGVTRHINEIRPYYTYYEGQCHNIVDNDDDDDYDYDDNEEYDYPDSEDNEDDW